MRVEKFANLPYPTILIPLTAFFAGPEGEQLALTNDQVQTLKNWFWRVIFARRYSSATKRNLENDIREAKRLRSGEHSNLGNFEVTISASMFSERRFIAGTVDTKAFILILASQGPKSIVNGGDVHIGRVLAAGNKSEFHHIFPQAFLRDRGIDPAQVNCLANFCMLSASDNKKVGSKSPTQYRDKLADNVDILLPSNLIPPSMFSDDFNRFIGDRSGLLASASYQLMGRPTPA